MDFVMPNGSKFIIEQCDEDPNGILITSIGTHETTISIDPICSNCILVKYQISAEQGDPKNSADKEASPSGKPTEQSDGMTCPYTNCIGGTIKVGGIEFICPICGNGIGK